MSKETVPEPQLLGVLELQLIARHVHDVALERYVSNRNNLGEIGDILERALGELGKLRKGPGSCPDGWVHEWCLCRPRKLGPNPPPPPPEKL